ncbi:MAG: TraR/DksA C4-type zinc finger protein [Smithellaceae bacterium]|nr:TraR/DksA C4-type zinc finger protein [Smithellaceae bacterium]
MKSGDILSLRNKLCKKIEELREVVEKTNDGKKLDTFDVPDLYDRATLEHNFNSEMAMRNKLESLLHDIHDAVVRIDSGTFGNCEKCGNPIPTKRIFANPLANQCIHCMEKTEMKQKIRRLVASYNA